MERPSRLAASKDQRWSTFLRNHANGIVACDFFVSAGFLYTFIALEIGSRRLLHFNATEHLTSEWTLHEPRGALRGDQDYKFLFHDRHNTFLASLDETVESWAYMFCDPRFVCPSPTLTTND
jgi:putative transposase